MKSEHSDILLKIRPVLKEVITLLKVDYSYLSFLCTDSEGLRYSLTQNDSSVENSMWTERGIVCRAGNAGHIVEFSFNYLPMENSQDAAAYIKQGLDKALLQETTEHPYLSIDSIEDSPDSGSFSGDYLEDPFDSEIIFNKLSDIKDQIYSGSPLIVNGRIIYEGVKVSRMFLSPQKDMIQSYVWSQAYIFVIARKDSGNKTYYKSFSGMRGAELIDEMGPQVPFVIQRVEELTGAGTIIPGEYEVIFSPDISGMIAHEAFGHGVEMDMFVKGRALASSMIGERVASEIVSLYDGAASTDQVASYLFDDEGTRGQDTPIIEKGILKRGISDIVSASLCNTPPTGNGRRESFERKVYSRMTNTFFGAGSDSLESMIKSISKGYLIEKALSGMEDPKNWGIQVMAIIGREIIDGKLTGKIVSPVILTGSLPEVLGGISMVSKDLEFSGSGYCGKGYKEYVKVSTGGPYIKTKMRLS